MRHRPLSACARLLRHAAPFAMLASCGAIDPPPELPRAQTGWQVSETEPVLPAGALRDRALWNDPNVLRIGGGYMLYTTTSISEPFKPPVVPFRAISSDGSNWALSPADPLLSPAGGPYASIETPSVVQFGGRYYMAFTGIYPNADPTPMAIGLATSADGKSWRVTQWTLLKATGGATDWNGYLVGEPGAVVFGNRLMIYFSAVGARAGGGPPLQSIGLIESSDGTHFSTPRQVLTQGPLYPVDKGYAGYSSPAALARNGWIDLFYSVVHIRKGDNPEWQQVAIQHARSADGIALFREDSAPIVTRDSTAWTGGEILAPAPLIDGKTLKLWFGGHVATGDLGPLINRNFQGPEFGIGLATKPLDQFDKTP